MATTLNASVPAVVIGYGPSKLGKCLAEDAEILLADGRVATIGDLAKSKRPVSVVAMDRDYKLRAAQVARFHDDGLKDVFTVHLASGRRLTSTATTAYYTERGWTPAGEIAPRTLLAVPRALPFFGASEALSEAQVKFLAYHLADGRFDDGAISFTSSNPEKVADWTCAVALAFPDVEVHPVTLRGEATITYRLARRSGDRRTSTAHTFLRNLGLDGKASATKFVPEVVFTLTERLVALFLSRYLGCDGAVHADGTISFSSASERMLRQVAHLLLRFGANGRIRSKVVKGETYWEWQGLSVETTEAVRRRVGIFTKPIPERHVVVPSKHDRLPVRWAEVPRPHPSRPADRHQTSYLSRVMGQALFDVGDEIHRLAHSDLFWDEVVEVVPAGRRQTFDLTVPFHQCFVAQDVLVHNTTDCIYSFPSAVFIALRAALKPSESVVGISLPDENILNVNTVPDATKAIKAIAARKGAKPPAVVVDDFSLLCEQTMSVLEQKLSGFKLWGALRDEVLEFRDACRQGGMHVVVNAHENAPRTVNGAYIRGGPRLPGRLPEDFPAACDLVLRAVPDPMRPGWKVAYRCTETDPAYITGDRHGVTPDMAPMNLAEILRSAGYRLPRAPGMEWLEEVVEGIAMSLLERPSEETAILTNVTKYVIGQRYPNFAEFTVRERERALLPVRWAIRDGRDRAVLRRARMNPLASYGIVV